MSHEFPTVVYKSPGAHQCPGSTYSYKAASDDVELSALLGAGWFRTLPEALAGGAEEPTEVDPVDDSAPTRAELETMATELGIKFDGRTTDAGLLKKINAELESQ